jgi:beta propeller repeat protein
LLNENTKAVTAMIVAGMMLLMFSLVGQAEASVIEKEGNPVQMVLTDWGGVSLNLQGQEKYFKVWERSTSNYTKINLSLTNIDSYDVDGRNLVYTISSGSSMDVYLYNLLTGENKTISRTFTAKRSVKICGDRIAWVDYGIGSGGIYIYNLTDGSSASIRLQESKNIELALTDTYLAYIGHQNGINGVFIYNLQDGSTIVVNKSYGDKASFKHVRSQIGLGGRQRSQIAYR